VSQSRPWLALTVPLFCLPLFLGLGRADIEHDEAIYSFAVDRILETGDWLEPKSIPNEDWAFLEKPPLKFWLVAAPIKIGLLPHSAFGIRFWDALFGSLAFLYVFAIGHRLAGAFCGASAVLVLVAHRPLLFEHGLRTNNMEAALLLAYCGGIWHYLAWVRSDAPARARHIAAIAVYFTLGFMTKFVAVAFLPAVLGLATLCNREARRVLVRDWRPCLVASVATFAAIAPWFIWASIRYGSFLWATILQAHVYTRFTASLDPTHLQPWHYYLTTMFARFTESGQQWLVVVGFLTLVAVSTMRRSLEGWTIAMWAAVPVVAISFGTSKIYHYVYPFLPPLALGVGYVIALLLMVGVAPLRRALLALQARLGGSRWVAATLRWPPARGLMVTIATAALLVAALTLLFGPINLEWHGQTLFKSSGLFRPIVVALVFGVLAGAVDAGSRATAVILVSSLLPLAAYREVWSRIAAEEHPIRQARDCVRAVDRHVSGPGLYVDVPPEDLPYGLYYHFRQVRPWERTAAPSPAALGAVLEDRARPRAILVLDSTYQRYTHVAGSADGPRQRTSSPPMRTFPPGVVLLLPGPYAACASDREPVARRR
jgi:4-amino-4-deoxy-L-arabinose transferase-like glycosyltransferase